MRPLRFALIALLFLFSATFLQAQQASRYALDDFLSGVKSVSWEGERAVESLPEEDLSLRAPECAGCSYHRRIPNLPMLTHELQLKDGQRVKVSNIRTEADTLESDRYASLMDRLPEDAFDDADWWPSRQVRTATPGIARGQVIQGVVFYPLQIHRSGKQVRRTTLFMYDPEVETEDSRQASSRQQRGTAKTGGMEPSVLADGDWYKVATQAQGLYKLTYNDLKDLGINVDELNPRKIRVFGNGGGMLPQKNSEWRPEDLVENPILVQGEGDGRFDKGDAVYFYGDEPDEWRYMPDLDRFAHFKHLYSDTLYYFVNVGQENGKRVQSLPDPGTGSEEVTTTPQVATHHVDKHNLLGMGRLWFGEKFDLKTTHNVNLSTPNAAGPMKVKIRGAARAGSPTSMRVRLNGEATNENVNFSGATVNQAYTQYAKHDNAFLTADPADQLQVALTYNKNIANDVAWLDYIEVNYPQHLRPSGDFYRFFAMPKDGADTQTLRLADAAGYTVWDVTNPRKPKRVAAQVVGNDLRFDLEVGDDVHRLVAFRTSGAQRPITIGKVDNQNLHSLPFADYLMVTPKWLFPAAKRLKKLHETHYNRSVHLVTPQSIYNEFSGGRRDVTAIRDFVRHFYVNAPSEEQKPKYLLLFGDASYDFRGRNDESHRPIVPIYTARTSLLSTDAYSSDDYFTFMDENEGFWGESSNDSEYDTGKQTHFMDLGVGRLPVNNLEQAHNIVDKELEYISDPSNFGSWRNKLTFLADIKKSGGTYERYHMSYAETTINKIHGYNACINTDKVYLDSYPGESQGAGTRYPRATEDLMRNIEDGSLIVNYYGHGGETGLSGAYVFEMENIKQLSNKDRYSFWITATCEFGRFDNASLECGAEVLVEMEEAGAIGVFTAMRPVYNTGNRDINLAFYDKLFQGLNEDGQYPPLGEVFYKAKNTSFSNGFDINSRSFALLADPGLVLGLPGPQTAITNINQGELDSGQTDTLKALQRVQLEGEVRDPRGNRLSNFNGTADITVLDKPQEQTTRKSNFSFDQQDVVLFRGKASVTNGRFSLEFTMPLEIDYRLGKGNIIVTAESGEDVRIGCTEDVVICCNDEDAEITQEPPTVDLYLNDRSWEDGGITHQDPLLIADVKDDQGISATGLGVGRDLKAVLDNDETNPIVLNKFYQAKLDQANAGTIKFQLRNVSEGEHEVEVEVWDLTNNSATATTTFLVVDSAESIVREFKAFPNPFTDEVAFNFEHNQNGRKLRLRLDIVNQNGRRVHSFMTEVQEEQLSEKLRWDGQSQSGQPLSPGIYNARLSVVVPETGQEETLSEKLILMR